MVKYKLILNPKNNLPDAKLQNNLSNLNGYLVHENSNISNGELVNEDNVDAYLTNPQNAEVVEKLKEYIKEYVNDAEFEEIYYTPKKIFPILNDFYNEEIRFNSEANPVLITDALRDTQQFFYTENNFDFLKNQRMNYENKTKVLEVFSADTVSEYRDFYIDVAINIREDSLFGTDFSQYFKNEDIDGTIYVQSFVNLNKQTDPFFYWTNNKQTKVWKRAPEESPQESIVEEFEKVSQELEDKLKKIKDNNSIEYTVAANKAKIARKISDKKRANLEKRKKTFRKNK
mgnify:CR=1 FL=1